MEPGHADAIETAVSGGAAAQSPLVASWARSFRHYGHHPTEKQPPRMLSAADLGAARERLGSLIETAGPSLDRLYRAVGGAGCCVLLADAQGVPVDRRGAAGDDETFHSWGLWTGAVWSEQAEGTNGIGTCIAEKRPLTIHRDQHFLSRNTGLSCTAAPVFDQRGQLVAVVDISSWRPDLTAGFVNLVAVAVAEAARRIEALNFRQAFPGARIMLAGGSDSDNDSERGTSALLAVDSDDLVIGASRAARQLLGLNDESLAAPVPAADLLGQAMNDRREYEAAEHGVVQRALARSGGRVSAAAASLGISRATLHRKIKRLGLHG